MSALRRRRAIARGFQLRQSAGVGAARPPRRSCTRRSRAPRSRHYPAAFEVHQDRPVTGPTAEREVVDAEDLHFLCAGRDGAFGPREQGVAAGEEAQLGGEPCARPASEPQDDGQQRPLQPVRLPGPRCDVGQPLAEDPSLARGLVAEEAPRSSLERHGNTVPEQIRDGVGIMTACPGGASTADRADAPRRAGLYAGAHSSALHVYALEFQALRKQFAADSPVFGEVPTHQP